MASQELNQALWNAANVMRSTMSADEYKDCYEVPPCQELNLTKSTFSLAVPQSPEQRPFGIGQSVIRALVSTG